MGKGAYEVGVKTAGEKDREGAKIGGEHAKNKFMNNRLHAPLSDSGLRDSHSTYI